MTLDGLTVEQWLREQAAREHEPLLTAPVPVPATEGHAARRATSIPRLRAALVWAAALAVGAWLALPALGEDTTCPPPGEGATACHLQHNVLQATMTLLLVTAGIVIAAKIVLGLPGFVSRVRQQGLLPRSPSADVYADPILIAANRGHVV